MKDDAAYLLRPRDVSELTGLTYESALAFTKAHGIRLGGHYYITRRMLVCALALMASHTDDTPNKGGSTHYGNQAHRR